MRLSLFKVLCDVMLIAGLITFDVGVLLFSRPAGVMVAGAELTVLAFLLGYRRPAPPAGDGEESK